MAENQKQISSSLETLVKLGMFDINRELYEQSLRDSNLRGMENSTKGLSNVISNGETDKLFLYTQPQAISDKITNYLTQNQEKFEEAYKNCKDGITSEYINLVANIKEEIGKKAGKNKNILKLAMYTNIGSLLSKLELNEEILKEKEYQELVGAYFALKEIEKAKVTEKSGIIAKTLTRRYQLGDDATNLMNDWTQYEGRLSEIYARMIGEKLLDENLNLDKEKFEKVFGNAENYAKLAVEMKVMKEAMKQKESKK